MTAIIENRTFEEIQIGETASLTRALRPDDMETWASVTGNPNLLPAAKEEGAATGGFGRGGGGAFGQPHFSLKSSEPGFPGQAR